MNSTVQEQYQNSIMKFLILLLAIIAFSNCEDLEVLVKNFEAKINALLAAKNFDGISKYLVDNPKFYVNKVQGGPKQDFINYLKNGTFVMFNGISQKDVPEIRLQSERKDVKVFRNLKNGRELYYVLVKRNGTEFGYQIGDYLDYHN